MDATITNLSTERVFVPGPQIDLAPTGDPSGDDVKTWPDVTVADLDNNARLKELVVDGTLAVSLDNDSYDAAQATQGSMVYGNLPLVAHGDLPLAAANGAVVFVTDGRKVGEGAGAGTGVAAYFDLATTTWMVFSTDTAVLV
jgi:hypothetical protein